MSRGSSTTQTVVGVPSSVGADRAALGLGQVVAHVAETHAVLGRRDRGRERERVLLGDLQQVIGDALRRLRADARQSTELVDQVLDGIGVHGWLLVVVAEVVVGGLAAPNRPDSPPSIELGSRPPIAPAWSAEICVVTSRSAASDEVLERLDVGRVDDLGDDGDARTSPLPVAVTRTTPPPARPRPARCRPPPGLAAMAAWRLREEAAEAAAALAAEAARVEASEHRVACSGVGRSLDDVLQELGAGEGVLSIWRRRRRWRRERR